MAKKRKKNIENLVIYESSFNYKKIGKFVVLLLISAGITLFLIIAISNLLKNMKNKNPIKLKKRKIEFTTNNIYYFDPVYLVKDLENNNLSYVLIDTRSEDEYKTGHIRESINIPLYKDYSDIEKTKVRLTDFRKNVVKNNPKNKIVVLYGYYAGSEFLHDGAMYLYKSGIKTQVLSVSWYEFKNNPFLWMPGNDLGTVSIEKYLEGTLYENK